MGAKDTKGTDFNGEKMDREGMGRGLDFLDDLFNVPPTPKFRMTPLAVC